MNLVLLFESDFINEKKVRLAGRRYNHILKVLKAKEGDPFTVGLAGGKIGKGEVTEINDKFLELNVSLEKEPPQPLPITLVMAVPRPKVLRRVIQSACTMGVKRIILINAYRVEKSFWQSPVLTEEKLHEQLVLGLEQACDTIMPEIEMFKLFKPFVEDVLPSMIEGTNPLVAHPYTKDSCPSNPEGHITLAVGPEGGFIQYEVDKLIECGFKPVHLGERILRVESAVPALISKLTY